MKAIFSALVSCTLSVSLYASDQSTQDRAWITIGSDASQVLTRQAISGVDFQPLLNVNASAITVGSLPVAQVESLSDFMHHEFNRCAGFMFHESFADAQLYATLPNTQINNSLVSYSIDNAISVNALLSEMNSGQLSATVNTLSAYNNRYYTQQTGVDAADWTLSQWQSIANGRSDIQVALYSHSWAQSSVVATITGTTYPNEVVIIGGHLDSINQSNPSSGRAPGSDDNASGIAVITETLRAMVAADFKPARTVKIIAYAAEEVGLRGSKAIAEAHKAAGTNVIGVAQFDMSGYKGTGNKDIVFMTDYTNTAQNQFMAQLIDTYLQGVSYGYDQCGYGCSDHASWTAQGYAASMPFESNMSDINPNIHTAYDNTFDAQHSLNFAKLAATFVAELAKGGMGDTPPPPPADNVLVNGQAKTGLSAATGSDLLYTLSVPTGASNMSFSISGGSGDADMYVKFGSAPTDAVYDCRPYKNGNSETCTGTATGGTYYVRVKAYSSFANLSLTGSYTEGGGQANPPINETISGISVAKSQWARYTQTLAAGYSNLQITMSGGSGDADLYVRHNAASTTSSYDCRPYKNGNAESCSFTAPAAGTWYIDVRGYSAASGVTLNIVATP